ncbi:MAG: hypothetical protein OXF11_22305 [Deltaproteobacteria bacterium]|nr:hypothetical protein [Deltaproteobacteria bacterium]
MSEEPLQAGFYVVHYQGVQGSNHLALYIGNGVIAGIDVGGIQYYGQYQEGAGRIKANFTLTAPISGGQLVTGTILQPQQKLEASADLPRDLTSGAHSIVIGNGRVTVAFEKLYDLP